MKVLIASCVRQELEVLKEFLQGLDDLKKPGQVDYYFILHNITPESKDLVYRWSTITDLEPRFKIMNDDIEYVRDDATTHIWTPENINKVIEMKNHILNYARKGEYDYLFFTDSDQVYHPNTLIHLISQNKDIVGEISWAKWTPTDPDLPNAWFGHPYWFDDRLMDLREKGLCEVAGFGGCYLISRKALQTPISFNRTDAKTNWGEDRYFHIRAKELGFISYVDTTYPYFHIYRKTDLPHLAEWKKNYTFPEIEAEKGKVLIGICIGEREIHPDLTVWLIKTFKQHPDWGLEISRMHPIDSNRNAIVKKFMTLREAWKYEWLLFVDTDIVPPLGAVDRLLKHDKKVVGGVCFIMSPDTLPTPNISKEMKRGHYKAELTEVKGMGTGFILIHRDVLRDIGKSPFRFQYDDWGLATVSGEDYDFCEKAVNKGYTIYADFGIQCSHYKQVDLTRLNKTLFHIITEANTGERRPKKPVSDSPSSGSGN